MGLSPKGGILQKKETPKKPHLFFRLFPFILEFPHGKRKILMKIGADGLFLSPSSPLKGAFSHTYKAAGTFWDVSSVHMRCCFGGAKSISGMVFFTWEREEESEADKASLFALCVCGRPHGLGVPGVFSVAGAAVRSRSEAVGDGCPSLKCLFTALSPCPSPGSMLSLVSRRLSPPREMRDVPLRTDLGGQGEN